MWYTFPNVLSSHRQFSNFVSKLFMKSKIHFHIFKKRYRIYELSFARLKKYRFRGEEARNYFLHLIK